MKVMVKIPLIERVRPGTKREGYIKKMCIRNPGFRNEVSSTPFLRKVPDLFSPRYDRGVSDTPNMKKKKILATE